MEKITIAGGSGFLGVFLEQMFLKNGHDVSILTRSPSRKNHVLWDPDKGLMDFEAVKNTTILINLSGANIGEGTWDENRKKELIDSRVNSTNLLFKYFHSSESLKKYITASGINCYPLEIEKTFVEEDAFGTDFVSNLVRLWENSAEQFAAMCPVYKLRMGIILHREQGALPKLIKVAKYGLASGLGDGKQNMTWVHVKDVTRFCLHIISHANVQPGSYNLTGENISNKSFMKMIARTLGRPFFLPNIPEFVVKRLFGEKSILLLKGIKASNSKSKGTGFNYQHELVEEALVNLLQNQ